MSAMSFTEIDGQHVELLPARTVLSGGGPGVDGDATSGDASGGSGGANGLIPILNNNTILSAAGGDINSGGGGAGGASSAIGNLIR